MNEVLPPSKNLRNDLKIQITVYSGFARQGMPNMLK